MANQRAKNVRRITITLPDDLLEALKVESEKVGKNRLEVVRETLAEYLQQKQQKKTKTQK